MRVMPVSRFWDGRRNTVCHESPRRAQVRTRFRHFGLLLALSAVWSAGRASDIDCARTQQSAERVICDHAILAHRYDRIYGQQQALKSAGKLLSAEDLVDWQQLRNTCTDVHCIDGVFAQWESMVNAI